jgi:hypothetical protein
MDNATDAMLNQFFSDPPPRMIPHPGAEQVRFTLEGEDVGTQAAVDSVFARVTPAFRSRFATPERGTTGIPCTISRPHSRCGFRPRRARRRKATPAGDQHGHRDRPTTRPADR